MRTSLALLALTCSGCIFLYSEVEENAGGRGGQGGYGGGTSAQGASTQGGSGGTSGTGGAGGQTVSCDAEKTVRVVARFEVTSPATAAPTPIAVGASTAFLGTGSTIYQFDPGAEEGHPSVFTDALGVGSFDDLLFVEDTGFLLVGHQASAYGCDVAQAASCEEITGSPLTGFVPWLGGPPFDGARFLALRKTDSTVVRGDGMGGLTLTNFAPTNTSATEAFDLAINGQVVGVTTYNPGILWQGTLSQPDLSGTQLPVSLTPSHLVVRNDGSIVVAVGNTVSEKLMRVVGGSSSDFLPGLFDPLVARNPLAYDPTCDVLYGVVGLSPQQIYGCVDDVCAPVGGSCGRVTGITPAGPGSLEPGAVYFACIDHDMNNNVDAGTIWRVGP